MKPETGVEHVVKGDDAFMGRMRFHQSWVRRQQSPLLKAGPHPMKTEAHRLLGNMLAEPDAENGCNFLLPEIAAYAKKRQLEVPKNIERGRLLRNMLGSQPMCFNLFTPLALDHDLATRLLSTLPGAPAMKSVTKVVIEFAPTPKPLGDGTSHDAFVEYEDPSGKTGFLAFETKLTEPFSQKHYDFHQGYSKWQTSHWWWQQGAEAKFSDLHWNQLWRNHLLSYAMLNEERSKYAQCHNAVVYHQHDSACVHALQEYQSLLTPQGASTLLDWRLDILVQAWEAATSTSEERVWLEKFRQRYLNLNGSESEWSKYRQ